MQILSTVFRIALQIVIVLAVPGGLPAVIIYQYRLYKKRRDAKNPLPADGPLSSPPTPASSSSEQPLPQSHP